MAYRIIVFAFVLGAGCGRDTGILVQVARDPALTQPIERLRFVFGDNGGQGNVFVRSMERTVDVTGRDLLSNPYSLLVRPDSAQLRMTASITVAVLAEQGDVTVGFGALAGAQSFVDGEVLRRDVLLQPDDGAQVVRSSTTGCLLWPEARIVVADDRDCDGDPATTDCNDADPTVNSAATEVCGNNRDDNCNAMVDEGCPTSVCTEGDMRPCYSGPSNTQGVGSCRGGTETCRGGQWSACIGEVLPAGELCNGLDDDCDGTPDDGLPMVSCGVGACARTIPACASGQLAACTPTATAAVNDATCNGIDDDCDGMVDEDCVCVHVAPTGNDTVAVTDNNVTPFATIPAAIAWAAGDPGRPKTVCVAAGATCGANATFTMASLTMVNGISVYGNYEATTWTPCAQAPTAVRLQISAAEGVLFPSSVNTPTTLSSLMIQEPQGSSSGNTRAGITVDGATHVSLTNLQVQGFTSGGLSTTVGVDLKNGAEALITRSQISAGSGSQGAYAIRSKRARPTVRGNCPAFDNRGRCNTFCTPDGPGLRGRQGGTSGESFVVLLEESPGAVVESNALCGAGGATGAGVRVRGDAAGVLVRASFVSTGGGQQDEAGVWLDDCNDAVPYVIDNTRIEVAGGANARVSGVRVAGKCHPVIAQNDKIIGGSEGGSMLAEGVVCGANGSGAASNCVISDNLLIEGSASGVPPTSVAVRCDGGACRRVSNNGLDGRGGQETIGLWLARSAALVDRNRISGGCGASAIGVRADDAASRLENNRVVGGLCESAGQRFVGLRATLAGGPRELDVHSNTLDGGGGEFACRSAAVELAVGMPAPAGGVGVFRNNIFRGGLCMTARVGFSETSAAADPRILDHNDFDPTGPVTAIYRDEDMRALQTLAELDALNDAVVTGNISVDPLFVNYPTDLHLQSGSMCINAGTATGAPARDMDNILRDSMPDIGADEK